MLRIILNSICPVYGSAITLYFFTQPDTEIKQQAQPQAGIISTTLNPHLDVTGHLLYIIRQRVPIMSAPMHYALTIIELEGLVYI